MRKPQLSITQLGAPDNGLGLLVTGKPHSKGGRGRHLCPKTPTTGTEVEVAWVPDSLLQRKLFLGLGPLRTCECKRVGVKIHSVHIFQSTKTP